MVDMAHIAGLVAAGLHPSPFPHADLVTTTTHKTLRGPRGGLVFCRADLAKQVDKAVFPGIQGGPLMHVIAAKAVALQLAATDEFRADMRAHRRQRRSCWRATLADSGCRVVSGGTDNHLMLVDVTPLGVTGTEAETLLDAIGITVNKNAIPFDPLPPNTASGIRVGTPATTTRGFGAAEMREVGRADRERDRAAATTTPRMAVLARRGPRHLRALPGARPARGVSPAALERAPGHPRSRSWRRRCVSFLLTPLAIRLAPGSARSTIPTTTGASTRGPIPRTGGLAVAAAFVGVGVARPARSTSSFHFAPPLARGRASRGRRPVRRRRRSARVIGYLDDRLQLRARWQLLGQLALAGARDRRRHPHRPSSTRSAGRRRIAGVLVVDIAGFAVDVGAAAVTTLWVVGMINSVNFIDGLDGLLAGVALIAAITLGIISLLSRADPAGGRAAVRAAGRLAARLPALELPSGAGLHRHGRRVRRRLRAGRPVVLGTAKVAVALLVLGVPIIDTFWIIIRRLAQGRSPFSADRGHFHHRLLDLGLTHRGAVLLIYAICAVLAAAEPGPVRPRPAVGVRGHRHRRRPGPVPDDARGARGARGRELSRRGGSAAAMAPPRAFQRRRPKAEKGRPVPDSSVRCCLRVYSCAPA